MKFLVLTILATCCVGTSNSMIQKWIEGTTDFNSMWNALTKGMPQGFQVVIRKTSGGFQQQNPVPTTYSFMDFGPTEPTPTEPMPTEPPFQSATDAGPIKPIVTDSPVPQELPSKTIEKAATNKAKVEEATCTAERKIAGHTLCLPEKAGVVKNKSFLTKAQKKAILDHHNRLRGSVEPPATDLAWLVWDDRVAKVAQKWAEQCESGHDPNRELNDELGLSVGQNVAGGYPKFEIAVQAWWDEYKMWTYGKDMGSYISIGGWQKIGHFTQMAQNGTYLLGCGYAYCPASIYKHNYVCNYANGQSNIATPYTEGIRCSACPKSCVNGQCNCNGRVCKNRGTLDLNTCQCLCTKMYKGPLCEELNCPAKDDRVCGTQWTPDFCEKFINVPEECPYMCGVCKGNGANPVTPKKDRSKFRFVRPKPNGPVFVSSFNCTFRGERASLAECRKFKSKGVDKTTCASVGGKLGCSDCERYMNVPADMCPVMCGLCDAPCDGLTCKNEGVLDVDTCKCKCKVPYKGLACEILDCTGVSDKNSCNYFRKSYCDKYSNVKEECPIKCGIC